MSSGIKMWTKLVIILIIASASISILETYYFIGEFEEKIAEITYYHLETITSSRAAHVESFLDTEISKVETLSKCSAFIKFLKADENDEDYEELLEEANRRLEELSDGSLLNKDGMIIASTNSRKIGIDYSEGGSFLEDQTNSLPILYYDKLKEEDMIGTVAPINDPESGVFLGAIGSNLELAKLNEITLDRTGLGETGEVYIINKEGKLLTPSRFTENSIFVQEVNTVNSRKCLNMSTPEHIGHEPIGLFKDYRGENVLGTHVYMSKMEWCILAEIDESEVLGVRKEQLLNKSLTIIIITILAVGLIGFFVGKKLEKKYELREKASKRKINKIFKLLGKINPVYFFIFAIIFAVVYFFAITSLISGWQNALLYDDIPDVIFIVVSLVVILYGLGVKKETSKKYLIWGALLLLIAKLTEIPLQELQALGLVAPIFWYPIMIILFLGFLLILLSFKEGIK